jgi:acyl-CoA:acyl-CoA alkyltransferase
VLCHRGFPVDVRHNSKIDRDSVTRVGWLANEEGTDDRGITLLGRCTANVRGLRRGRVLHRLGRGCGLLVEASEEPGVLARRFASDPRCWAAVVPMRHPTGIHGDGSGVFAPTFDVGDFRVDIAVLMKAFEHADLSVITPAVSDLGVSMSDFGAVCVHQSFEASLPVFAVRLGAREDQLVPSVTEYGNVASAGLALQLRIAADRGQVRRGDLVALVSGTSYGCVVLSW